MAIRVTAIVTVENDKGFVWCETDVTHQSVFVHQSEVENQRVLHVRDRVEFELGPNPRKPGQVCGLRVRFLGHIVARQVSDAGVSRE